MTTKTQLIYKLGEINADDGVDIFEIAPILMSFGELIRSANATLGFDEKIDIKVKPFKEGSWITEFILQSNIVVDLINYLKSEEGNNLFIILAFLGLDAKSSVTSVIDVLRFTGGTVSKFYKKKNDDSRIIYENKNGEKIEVVYSVHKLIQSPLIQINYHNAIASPLEKFPTASTVSTKINIDGHNEQKFTETDKELLQYYAKEELTQDVDDNITSLNGVYLKPKRGSYSGEEKSYSFIMGETTLWPVAIEDDSFLLKLQTGEIRPFTEDVLKVNLEIRQKKDTKNKISTTYTNQNSCRIQ